MTANFINIRGAAALEAEALGALGVNAWEASAFADNDANRTDRLALLADFTQFCASSSDTILVAHRGNDALGWGAREHKDFRISDLWVGAHAQGQGAGSALLDALEVAIARAGYYHAELETFAGNAGAIRFYQRHGYQICWRGLKHSTSLNYAMDKVRLVKSLDGRLQDTGLPTA